MLSNKQLKYLKSLHQRKYRQKYGNFIVEGVKMGSEIIRSGNAAIEGVYAVKEWMAGHQSFIPTQPPGTVHQVTGRELSAISLLKTPNQVLFVLKKKENPYEKKELDNALSLYLDEIRDPGNMGTILRIADWFGVKWVFCSEGCVEVYSPKVVQASMGAFLRVKTKVMPLPKIKSHSPALPIVGATLNGPSIFDAPSGPARSFGHRQ